MPEKNELLKLFVSEYLIKLAKVIKNARTNRINY